MWPEWLNLASGTGLSHTLTGRGNRLTTTEQGSRPLSTAATAQTSASAGSVPHRQAQHHATLCASPEALRAQPRSTPTSPWPPDLALGSGKPGRAFN